MLVDSEALACQVDADVLTSLGIAYTRDEIISQFVGVSLKDMMAQIEREHERTLPADFADTLNRTLFARFERELRPIEGVRDAILALPHRRCVASSSLPERIAFSLRLTGLDDLFEHVFSASEVQRGKPAPDLFLHAAERMGSSADALRRHRGFDRGRASGTSRRHDSHRLCGRRPLRAGACDSSKACVRRRDRRWRS